MRFNSSVPGKKRKGGHQRRPVLDRYSALSASQILRHFLDLQRPSQGL